MKKRQISLDNDNLFSTYFESLNDELGLTPNQKEFQVTEEQLKQFHHEFLMKFNEWNPRADVISTLTYVYSWLSQKEFNEWKYITVRDEEGVNWTERNLIHPSDSKIGATYMDSSTKAIQNYDKDILKLKQFFEIYFTKEVEEGLKDETIQLGLSLKMVIKSVPYNVKIDNLETVPELLSVLNNFVEDNTPTEVVENEGKKRKHYGTTIRKLLAISLNNLIRNEVPDHSNDSDDSRYLLIGKFLQIAGFYQYSDFEEYILDSSYRSADRFFIKNIRSLCS